MTDSVEPSTKAEEKDTWKPEDASDVSSQEEEPAPKRKQPPGNVETIRINLLNRLQEFFEENDVPFEDGWRIEVKQRVGGSSAGTSDAYYYNPENKRYRSRAEIARDYGITVAKGGGRGGGGASAPRKPIVLLSREDALAQVKTRMESISLPLKLSGGITLTDFGAVKPDYVTETSLPLVGYTTEWVDSKGVRFISKIVDTGMGPYYSVRAILDKPSPSPGSGGDASAPAAPAQPVEVGSGLNPDAAWQAAAERQQEVTDLASLHKEEGSSHADEMEPGDSLLLRAAPLTGYWGTERFGLIDISCLQALEGQPGVESTNYKFVEERSSWDEVNRRLGREAAHHGKTLGTGPSRPRADRRPKSQGERDKAAVARVVENMVRQLEAMEAKNVAAEQRAMAKKEREAQRQLEKEQRRLAKEREREIARQLHEQRRALERAAAAEAARRAAEAARTFPDEDLAETATVSPPKPLPLASGRLPAATEPVLLEAWHLLNRFRDTLGINVEDIPSLPKLEASLLEGPAVGANKTTKETDGTSEEGKQEEDATVWVASRLVDLLIKDLFSKSAAAIAEASADVPEKDLRLSNKAAHPVPIGPDTWQEAARRYLSIVADAAACQAKLGEDGLPYPADHFEDFLIIQYLLAGPPTALARGWGALPAKGTSEHAWLGAVATNDAAAVAAAGLPEGRVANRDPAEIELTIRLQRCILRELANIKGKSGRSGKVLCFQGHGAGAATKMGRSLDLRYVGARVDTGFYAVAEDPMAAFKADIDFVTDLHQQANNKKYSGFYELNKEKGVAEVAAMVSSKLEAALAEVQQVGADAYLAEHSPPIVRPTSEGGDAMQVDGAEGNTAAEDEEPPESDPVRDLKRPFAPWEGCCVCWDDTDDERQLLCAMCSAPFHTYCLNPPLDDIPEDEWMCPGCAKGPFTAPPPKFPAGSGAAAIWEMAQLLGAKDYAEWTVDMRASLLSMLCMLVEDSPVLRDELIGEENAQRDMRKELFAKRNELKQKQQEEAAERNPQEGGAAAAGGEGGGAEPSGAEQPAEQHRITSRRARDIAAEMESIVQRISQLEHDVDQIQHPRLEALGLDRHYNRYWFLPSAALTGDPFGPGAVVIERYRTDTSLTHKDKAGAVASVLSPADGDWQVGLYKGIDSVTNLINWMNTKGIREKALEAELRTVRTRLHVQAQEAQRMEEEAKLDAAIKRAEEKIAAGAKSSENKVVEEKPPLGAGTATATAAEEDVAKKNLSPTERLRSALLDFEAGLASSARHPLHGRPEAMEAWRARVSAAQTPQEFMRGLISLEQGINPSYLKTHWRPWAMAAPHPDSAGTLAAVWLRLEALRGAIRMKVMIKFSRDMAGLGGGSGGGAAGGLRYPRRETKRVATSAPDSGIDSDAEGSAGGAEINKMSRAERAAKRSKTGGADGGSDMDDEEMARRLHAELNAVGNRGSRLRHGSTAGGGSGGKATLKEPSDGIEEEEEEEPAKGEDDAYEPGNE